MRIVCVIYPLELPDFADIELSALFAARSRGELKATL